jgi:hypothetical protein
MMPRPPIENRIKMRRLVKRENMTIAAGFKCTDGIILCSDTEEAVGDYGKRSRAKIVLYPSMNPFPQNKGPRVRKKSDPPLPPPPPKPEVIAAFAGAGDSDFIDKLVDYLWAKIAAPSSYAQKVSALEDGTIEFHRKYWPAYPADIRPEAHLLVGLWTKSQYGLLKVVGPFVTEVPAFTSVGVGASLAEYLTDRFYSQPLSVNDATSIAIYLLQEVKEHVRYCGGQSHILVMKEEGYAQFEMPLKIDWGEDKLRKLEEAVGPLILKAANGETETEDFEKSITEFTSRLRSIRGELQRLHSYTDAAANFFPGK